MGYVAADGEDIDLMLGKSKEGADVRSVNYICEIGDRLFIHSAGFCFC